MRCSPTNAVNFSLYSIQPIEPGLSHFEAFGFEAPACDVETLRERHRELSRRIHPDLFMTRSQEERRVSLIDVSAVNDAYRCLEDAMARARYWLEIAGNPLGKNNNRVDPALAAEIFEIQELAAELRAARDAGGAEAAELVSRLEGLRGELQDRVQGELGRAEQMMDEWPHDPEARREALAALKETVSTASYLKTTVRDVRAALDDTWRESVA